jgi:hypothetical protein
MSPRVGRRSWSVPCNPEPIPTRRRRRQTPRVGGTRPPQYGHPDQEFHQLGVMEAWSQPPLGRLTGVRDRQPCISDAAGAQGRNRASAAAAQVIPIRRLRSIHPACQQLIRGTRRSPTYPYERTPAHRQGRAPRQRQDRAPQRQMVGWPGASQPPAPTDPYVTVSRHTALVALII